VEGAASFFSGFGAGVDDSDFVDVSLFVEESVLLLFSDVLFSPSALSALADAAYDIPLEDRWSVE
jgi:hypothetical protein